MTEDWKDKETLERMYWEEDMSMGDIGNELGCDSKTVQYWLEKFDLGTRSRSEARTLQEMKKPLRLNLNQGGYEIIHDQYGQSRGEKTTHVLHHRLLAAVETPLNELEGKVVHHKNNVPWDNRRANLEVMTFSDHMKHHQDERHGT
jgi:hypothetical protein